MFLKLRTQVKYVTVHRYFRIWSEADEAGESILEQVLKKPVKSERIRNGRKACTSMVIVDAQSVKNSESAHVKGYDGGKKVSGIKRHVAVDTQGSPHACAVTAANVTDRTGAIDMLRVEKEQLMLAEKVLVDGSYTAETFANSIKNLLAAEVEVAKRSDLHSFVVIPKRWVVERSFSWLEKCRRLWKNCERLVSSSLAIMQLAFIRILLRKS